MRFKRFSGYKFSQEAELAFNFFSELYELRQQLSSIRTAAADNPMVVTASVNYLSNRIAAMTDTEEYVRHKSSGEAALEEAVMDIHRRVPEEQRLEAVSKLLGDDRIYRFLWEYLLKNAVPRVAKSINRDIRSLSDAEELAANALQDYLTHSDKEDSVPPIVRSLATFDPGRGELMRYITRGLELKAENLRGAYFRQKNREMSIDAPIGDEEGATRGDMLEGDSEMPDVDTLADRATALAEHYADYIQSLRANVENSTGTEKFMHEQRLQTILKSDVLGKIQRMQKLGNTIGEMSVDLKLQEKNVRKMHSVMDFFQTNNPEKFEELRPTVEQKTNEYKQELAKLEALYKEFTETEQFLYQVANTEKEGTGTEMVDVAAPKRKNPKKVQLDPMQVSILEDKLNKTRQELTPYLYKAIGYPSTKKELQALTEFPLFKSLHMHKGLNSPQDLMALLSSNPEDKRNLSTEALFYYLATQGTLYAKDRQVFDRAFEPTQLSSAEERRRATENFRKFFHNTVAKDPSLKEREGELMQLYQQWFEEPSDNNVFRTYFEFIDWYTRAAAYEKARQEVAGGKPWEQLDDNDRKAIAEKVYGDLYEGGFRPMHIAKINKLEPRYGLKTDATGEQYVPIMMDELYRISHMHHHTRGGNPEVAAQYTPDAWSARGTAHPKVYNKYPFTVADEHEIVRPNVEGGRYDFRVTTRRDVPDASTGTEEIVNVDAPKPQQPVMAHTLAKLVRIAAELNQNGRVSEADTLLGLVEKNG